METGWAEVIPRSKGALIKRSEAGNEVRRKCGGKRGETWDES